MNHHYPIIRKGHIRNSNPYHSPTLHHQGISYNGTIAYGSPYGASTERFQKRYSKKDLAKLEAKLAQRQQFLDKMLSKGEPRIGGFVWRGRVQRVQKQIEALQALVGMTPFEGSLEEQAMLEAVAGQPEPMALNMPLVLALGGLALVGIVIALR